MCRRQRREGQKGAASLVAGPSSATLCTSFYFCSLVPVVLPAGGSSLLKPDLSRRAPRSPRPPAASEDSAGFENTALGADPASVKRRSQGANDQLGRSHDLLGLKTFPVPRLSPITNKSQKKKCLSGKDQSQGPYPENGLEMNPRV